jgi:NAD(P)-dependent dehydrogenase (short-subunit alcohol dehydrogenase family)
VTRTVLITGGAGFIGSNLARRLVRGGDQVRILDDLSIGQTAYLDGVPHDLVRGSLADADMVRSAVGGVGLVAGAAIAFATGVLLWLLFGLLIGNLPIIISNAITLGLALAIVAMKLKYK